MSTNATTVLSGISHHTAPVDAREKFSLSQESLEVLLKELTADKRIQEACAISTCNRVEVCWVSHDPLKDRAFVEEKLFHSVSAGLRTSIYHLEEVDAFRHLFRVASGLDSMIIGEPQILGQIKTAYELAVAGGTVGAVLHKLYPRAFKVGKAVRTDTSIGKHAVSVCYAARELAEQVVGDLSKARVLMVGTGETGRLALKHFRAAGTRDFVIASSDLERSKELAEINGALAISQSELSEHLAAADIVIGASLRTGDQPYLISSDLVAEQFSKRASKPQFFIDLGVPRNFQPEIANLADLFLYNIDDLQNVVSYNLKAREDELASADIIVESELENFLVWYDSRWVEPAISNAFKEGEEAFQHELNGLLED